MPKDMRLFFIQIKCFQAEEKLDSKRFRVLIFSCMGLFLCLVYLIFMFVRLYMNNLDYKIWDMRTITIDDYSVDIPITDQIWNDFVNAHPSVVSGKGQLL